MNASITYLLKTSLAKNAKESASLSGTTLEVSTACLCLCLLVRMCICLCSIDSSTQEKRRSCVRLVPKTLFLF